MIYDYNELPIKFFIRLDLPSPAHLFPQSIHLEPNTDTSSANSGRRRFQALLTLSGHQTLRSGRGLVSICYVYRISRKFMLESQQQLSGVLLSLCWSLSVIRSPIPFLRISHCLFHSVFMQ